MAKMETLDSFQMREAHEGNAISASLGVEWYSNDNGFQQQCLSTYDHSYDEIGGMRMFHESHVNSVVS